MAGRKQVAGMVVALAGILGSLGSQTSSSPQNPGYTLKENVHLVLVPVTVKDRRGNLVDDLRQEDFRVFEDGTEKPIRYFSTDPVPLSAVVLVDAGMSESTATRVRSALRSLGQSLASDDEFALYLFDNQIRLVQDFTPRAELLGELVPKTLPEGKGPSMIGGPLGGPARINGVPVDRPGTAPTPSGPTRKRIQDALTTAAERLRSRPAGRRRVVFIISDGANGSDNESSYSQMLNQLSLSDASVYAVSTGPAWAFKWRDLLSRVARETGGDILFSQRQAALERAFFDLANEARNSYLLGFSPGSADGQLHEIRVRVERSGVHWTARNRFVAPPRP